MLHLVFCISLLDSATVYYFVFKFNKDVQPGAGTKVKDLKGS